MKSKSLFLTALSLGFFTYVNAQTIFTIGNTKITKQEITEAYNRNRTGDNDTTSLKSYADLFLNYKLKVKEARALHLDTLPLLVADVQNFKRQLSENYMTDEEETNKLLNEAMRRSAKDIHVVYFKADYKSFNDTISATKAITTAEELLNTSTDYNKIAQATGLKFSDAGYLTVFSVPYNFENLIYSLSTNEVGRLSTPSGIFLFKVIDSRDDIGVWKIAQILIAVEPGVNDDSNQKQRADSIYNLLNAGMPFDEAALKFSDDRYSYSVGGELPETRSGVNSQAFEKAMLSLKKDGDISKPVRTKYGYHIIKRMQVYPSESYVKQQLFKDDRIKASVDKFNEGISKITNPQIIKNPSLFGYADSLDLPAKIRNKALLRYNKKTVTIGDWIDYYRNNNPNKDISKEELWKKFIVFSNREYYRNNLEDFNRDFKSRINEFEEGNLLFEIMERKVWEKANADSVGLKKYYDDHKQNYVWEKSAELITFSSEDMNALSMLHDKMETGDKVEFISKNIHSDTSRVELTQLTAIAESELIAGKVLPLQSPGEGEGTFTVVQKIIPAGGIKSFDDARGEVVNDYQLKLEKEWVEYLRKKYSAVIVESEYSKLN
ncbi:MAG: peptidylprolyl isomerase [Bacteroidetes bacterium]|nr:peptidylprolyl isomerase [Bacteroidota bacterium]